MYKNITQTVFSSNLCQKLKLKTANENICIFKCCKNATSRFHILGSSVFSRLGWTERGHVDEREQQQGRQPLHRAALLILEQPRTRRTLGRRSWITSWALRRIVEVDWHRQRPGKLSLSTFCCCCCCYRCFYCCCCCYFCQWRACDKVTLLVYCLFCQLLNKKPSSFAPPIFYVHS